MQNNPRATFVKCSKCGCGNPPILKACRNCNQPMDGRAPHGQTALPPAAGRASYRKYWLLLVLLVPIFLGFKYFNLYGQVSIKKKAGTEQNPPADKTAALPDGAWYNQTLKSKFQAGPSTEEVLTKEIEATGGRKALKPLSTVQIFGHTYNCDCRLDVKNQNISSSTTVELKLKAPNKISKKFISQSPSRAADDGSTTEIIITGSNAFTATYNKNTPKIFEPSPGAVADSNFDYFTASLNYASEYTDFSDPSVEKFNDRTAYRITAAKTFPEGNASAGDTVFYFDVMTGRLIGLDTRKIGLSGGRKLIFEDYRKVGEVYLPFKICADGEWGEQLVIDQWILDSPISDSEFSTN